LGDSNSTLILGDNVFYGHELEKILDNASQKGKGATIFGYHVSDPENYGVVEFDQSGKAVSLEERFHTQNSVNCCEKHNFIRSEFKFKSVDYSEDKCTSCGIAFTKPLIQSQTDVYESGHYKVKGFFFIPLLINIFDFFCYHFFIRIRKFNKKSAILDFGCGKGFFLYFLKKCGYSNIQGVETSPSRAAFSKERTGLKISTDYYESGKIMDKKYDLIFLIHVLEHIPEPFLFLDNLIKGSLAKDGSLFIEVPNINSTASKIAKKHWAHYVPQFHLNHFTINSIKNYCEFKEYNFNLQSSFSFYNSIMGMTSAILYIFGYRGVLFEDMKKRNLIAIFSFLFFLPISLILEFICSLFLNPGQS
jgi:2-polyprenyl-3-methyl-5-hydroxy-6-metoxy-1,4-benzoquinol methylase